MKSFILVLVITITACSQERPQQKKAPEKAMEQPQLTRVKQHEKRSGPLHLHYHNAGQVVSDTSYVFQWTSQNYYPNLGFDKDTLGMLFDGQCMYSYPVKASGKTITVYYAFIEDCTHEIAVREYKTGRPAIGKPFMTLTLINDSTLKAGYLYRQWADSVNAHSGKYPCFPEYFYAIEPY